MGINLWGRPPAARPWMGSGVSMVAEQRQIGQFAKGASLRLIRLIGSP